MKHFYNFINGQLSEKTKKSASKLSPHEHVEQFTYSNSDFLDIVLSVQSAHLAQKKWQETSFENRRQILKNFASLISESVQELAQMAEDDSGIPFEDAKKLLQLGHQRFLSLIQNDPVGQSFYNAKAGEYHVYGPVGIVGVIIGPEQAALHLLENLGVSLSCANLVILNPHESCIRISLKLAELASAAGLPAGVFNVILGQGEELSQNMVEHPGIKYLRFYGTNALGEKLSKIAAENNKRLFMSLGANNAAIVFSDSNLVQVVQQVLSLGLRFHFYGRNKINRVLIQEKYLLEFKAEFKKQFEQLNFKMGNSKLGPLSTSDEKIQFEFYQSQSKQDRAKVFIGDLGLDHSAKGFYVEPIIFEDLTNCSTLHQENLVGPIIFLQSFKYAHELGKILNSGAFAHRAYIWTDDQVRFQKIIQQIDSSEIFLNWQSPEQSELSHSTLKSSGLGSEGLEAMFEFNLQKKLVRTLPAQAQ